MFLESYQFLCKKMEALGVGEEKSFPETDKASGRTDGSKLVLQKRTEEQQYLDADFYVVCAALGGEMEFGLFCIVAVLAAVQYTSDPNVV